MIGPDRLALFGLGLRLVVKAVFVPSSLRFTMFTLVY